MSPTARHLTAMFDEAGVPPHVRAHILTEARKRSRTEAARLRRIERGIRDWQRQSSTAPQTPPQAAKSRRGGARTGKTGSSGGQMRKSNPRAFSAARAAAPSSAAGVPSPPSVAARARRPRRQRRQRRKGH